MVKLSYNFQCWVYLPIRKDWILFREVLFFHWFHPLLASPSTYSQFMSLRWIQNKIIEALPPALLRYNSHITLYNINVYNVLIWYYYELQNDYYHSISNDLIPSHSYCFLFVVRTFGSTLLAHSRIWYSIISYNHRAVHYMPKLLIL